MVKFPRMPRIATVLLKVEIRFICMLWQHLLMSLFYLCGKIMFIFYPLNHNRRNQAALYQHMSHCSVLLAMIKPRCLHS